MSITTNVIKVLVNLFKILFPILTLPNQFMVMVDNLFSMILLVFAKIDYFVDLDVLFVCLFTVMAVKHWSFMIGLGKFVLKLIRG